jgi:hypothetical protein
MVVVVVVQLKECVHPESAQWNCRAFSFCLLPCCVVGGGGGGGSGAAVAVAVAVVQKTVCADVAVCRSR